MRRFKIQIKLNIRVCLLWTSLKLRYMLILYRKKLKLEGYIDFQDMALIALYQNSWFVIGSADVCI